MEHKETIVTALTIALSTLSVIGLGYGYKVSSLKLKLPTKQQGLKVVHEDKLPGKVIDIVCVHGLGGHPSKTWTSTSPKGQTNWLTDILPADLHEKCNVRPRVITYDYHTESRLSTYFPAFLRHHSRRLTKLLSKKRGDKARDRPLIFIAHSLGGLIVRDALVYSSASEIDDSNHVKEIQSSTIGVLYFGTPYRDGQNLQWSQILNRVMSVSGSELTSPDVDPLLWQDELFRLELDRYKSIEYKFLNVAFHEKNPTTVVKENARIVTVPKDLTIPIHQFDLWESHPLNRDHENLCKFESRDSDYETVFKAIAHCLSPKSAQSIKASNSEIEILAKSSVLDDGDGDPMPMVWRVQSFPTRAVIDNLPAAQTRIIYLEERVASPMYLKLDFETDLQTGLDLIDLYEDSNEHDKSEALYKQLKKATKDRLDEFEAQYGYRDARSLRLAADLARIYAAAGLHHKSESLNRRLFVIVQDIYGRDSLQCAFVLNQLAHNAHAQGEHEKAVSLLQRVRQIQSERYIEGNSHPETLRTIARLAIVLDKQGKYVEAQSLYKEVIRCREKNKTMGLNHLETLKAMENLALSYRLQGQPFFHLAADMYQEVLHRRREVLRRYPPSGLANPDMKVMADECLCLYNETMTKLIEVVRQLKDDTRIRELEDGWSQVQKANSVEMGFQNPTASYKKFNRSDVATQSGSNDDQPSSSLQNRINFHKRRKIAYGVDKTVSHHRAHSNATTVSTDENVTTVDNGGTAAENLQEAGSWPVTNAELDNISQKELEFS